MCVLATRSEQHAKVNNIIDDDDDEQHSGWRELKCKMRTSQYARGLIARRIDEFAATTAATATWRSYGYLIIAAALRLTSLQRATHSFVTVWLAGARCFERRCCEFQQVNWRAIDFRSLASTFAAAAATAGGCQTVRLAARPLAASRRASRPICFRRMRRCMRVRSMCTAPSS